MGKTTTKPSKEIKTIHIKGAKSNNLKDIELIIPKDKLIVVTGLSGSGKSSLIMDTLYAEGQRRYVESLSSYARQFLSRMKKPEVDYIKGLCPAIAIEQKVTTGNSRSTVGSMTEIYDFLRLLYARIGKTYSPISGKLVKKHQVSDVMDYISKLKKGSKIQLFCPLSMKYEDRTLETQLKILIQKGFTRIQRGKTLEHIEDILEAKPKWLKKLTSKLKKNELLVLIDRFVNDGEEENIKRIADSVQTAFYEGDGELVLDLLDDNKQVPYNNKFELDGMLFLEPSHQLFNYNNPYGACKTCEGYGRIIGVDPYKVIPNENLSLYDGAVACWKGEKSGRWLTNFISSAKKFPIHRPYKDLTQKQKELVWDGNDSVFGIKEFFSELASQSYKIQNRVMMARYRGRTTCPDCHGGRLRDEADYVKIDKKSIKELINIPMDELADFFKKLKLNKHDSDVAKRILLEINTRIQTMLDVGLSYLTLDRISSSLSGGESQRINLTRTLSSNLTNSLYILDEPSIGLHPKDTGNLIKVLKGLRDLRNTVIVVEHEEEVIDAADYIVDIGPKAGIFGGELVYSGTYKDFKKTKGKSLTADYLTGKMSIPTPKKRRKVVNKIELKGARQHNLKDVNATFPLNCMTVVSGVSGSGKTTLVKKILYPGLKKKLGESISQEPGLFKSLTGDFNLITKVEMINQSPIGKSSRSNPATYVKAYDAIRSLFASQQASKIKGLAPKHFSFNVEGGRCEKCKGEGEETVEMQFLADVKLLCEDCRGKRFKQEVLEVEFQGKNISDILNLSVEEAIDFFADKKEILNKIKPLYNVGLGYVKLGQSSNTLSGGEAQRVKLASYLGKESSSEKIFFIFDEPTTGLHFHDIKKLLDALNALVEKGHTVVIVEHNMEVIKSADWVIDLGPDGGKGGGVLLYEGKPEGLAKVKKSHTGKYLKEKL